MPSVAFDFETFKVGFVVEMAEESVGEFVEEEKFEIFVFFEVKNGFFGAKEKFFAFFEGEIWVGGD